MEVARWSSFAAEEKRRIWGRLSSRRRLGNWAGLLGGTLDLVEQEGQEWAMIWYEGLARLLFRFDVDGSLHLSLPDSGLAASLGANDEGLLLSRVKRWLADCQAELDN